MSCTIGSMIKVCKQGRYRFPKKKKRKISFEQTPLLLYQLIYRIAYHWFVVVVCFDFN